MFGYIIETLIQLMISQGNSQKALTLEKRETVLQTDYKEAAEAIK